MGVATIRHHHHFMAIWEYKVISSGKGGFATPALMENFLNQLGKDEWEIIDFRPAPDNPLAFQGLARRGTQREWTLEAAAAAQAKTEADKRRAEEHARREAEIEGRSYEPPSVPANAAEPVRDESLRRLRDTELDDDPDALAEEAAAGPAGDWDEWPEEDELPTLFDAIKPHLRKNQRGLGQAVAIDYLAKRWEQEDRDIIGALEECGFVVPDSEEARPEYFEFEGDLYWLNCNNRGQLFLNVREKPRPRFKVTSLRKLDPDDPAAAELVAEHEAEKQQEADRKAQQAAREAEREAQRQAAREAREAKAAAKAAPAEELAPPPETLPEGETLLALLLPRMRRNRRGPGISGSVSFLAKALQQSEEALVAALATLGLSVPAEANAKSEPVTVGDQVLWLNRDNRDGIWINGRRAADEAETPPPAPESLDRDTPPPADSPEAYTLTAEENTVEQADKPAKKKTTRKPSSRNRTRPKKSRLVEDDGTSGKTSLDSPTGEKTAEAPASTDEA
jgi:hypothetical protein